MDRFHARYSLASVLTAASGCGAASSTLAPSKTEHAPTDSSITTRRDAKIRNVFDRKRFFGVVSVGPTVLKPDEATDVNEALVIADTFGEVATDLGAEVSVVPRTSARAVPAVRI